MEGREGRLGRKRWEVGEETEGKLGRKRWEVGEEVMKSGEETEVKLGRKRRISARSTNSPGNLIYFFFFAIAGKMFVIELWTKTVFNVISRWSVEIPDRFVLLNSDFEIN